MVDHELSGVASMCVRSVDEEVKQRRRDCANVASGQGEDDCIVYCAKIENLVAAVACCATSSGDSAAASSELISRCENVAQAEDEQPGVEEEVAQAAAAGLGLKGRQAVGDLAQLADQSGAGGEGRRGG